MPVTSFASTSELVEYARGRRWLRSVVPCPDGTCDHCYGVVGCDEDGYPYPTCYNCIRYELPFRLTSSRWQLPRPVLSKIVPVTYSLADGFEGVLHRYKRDNLSSPSPARPALAALIGSILVEFLRTHRQCLDRVAGPITLATTVPPRVSRTWVALVGAIASITGDAGGDPWQLAWDHGLVERKTQDAHKPGQMDADYYDLGAGRDVTGATVLVVDDTWTSGATMASVACCLCEAGASAVIGLPLGRQIGSTAYGTTHSVQQQVLRRGWDLSTCVLCG